MGRRHNRWSAREPLLCAILLLGACSSEVASDDVGIADSDHDYIADAVETEPNNVQLYSFVVGLIDYDPSYPTGVPTWGTLQYGLNLPDEELGYYHYLGTSPANTDDWGIGNLLNSILQTGQRWDGYAWDPQFPCRSASNSVDWTPANRIGVLDLSQGNVTTRVFGGPFMEGGYLQHSWHRQGLDVDVRYLRTDRFEDRLDVYEDPAHFDIYGTVDLLNCFLALPNVELIFMDLDDTGIIPDPQGRVQHLVGHTNHFHVRIYNYPITW